MLLHLPSQQKPVRPPLEAAPVVRAVLFFFRACPEGTSDSGPTRRDGFAAPYEHKRRRSMQMPKMKTKSSAKMNEGVKVMSMKGK